MINVIKYMAKLIGMSMVIGLMQASLLSIYIRNIANISITEFRSTLIEIGPLTFIVMLVIFLIVVSLFALPIITFFLKHSRNEQMSDDYLIKLQKQAINYPYIFAGFAFLIFFFGSIRLSITFYSKFDLEAIVIVYGVLGGVVSGALNIPIGIFIVKKFNLQVLGMIQQKSKSIPKAARVGFGQSIRTKITVTFLIMIMGLIFYSSVIGFKQLTNIRDKSATMTNVGEMRKLMQSEMEGAKLFYIVLFVSGISFITLLAYLSSHDISESILKIKRTAKKISAGEFGERVQLITDDELGELAASVNEMIDELDNLHGYSQTTIYRIGEVVNKLGDTSSEIHTVVEQQGAGANEQAVTMEEISATSDTIVATSKDMARSMARANELMQNANSAALEGSYSLNDTVTGFMALKQHVENVAQSMVKVSESSHRVGEVLEIMDEITEKTNLLALNAAIESASAGEAGARFAVVADQVRGLAEEARDVSGSIKGVIEEIRDSTSKATMQAEEGQKSAEKGMKLMRVASQGFERITDLIREFVDLTTKVVEGTKTQEASLEQVSISIADVTSAAQEVAEGAKQTQSHLKDIDELTETLKEITNYEGAGKPA